MDNINIAQSLHNRMDYLISRQGVVSGNVANASTPNYLARDIDFDAVLSQKMSPMKQTDAQHMAGAKNNALGGMTVDKVNIRHDGNSVKLDEEMLKLQEIQMNYRLMTQLVAKHASMQRMAVSSNSR